MPNSALSAHPTLLARDYPLPQVSLIAKFKPSLKRLLEFVILGQFVVQQVRDGVRVEQHQMCNSRGARG